MKGRESIVLVAFYALFFSLPRAFSWCAPIDASIKEFMVYVYFLPSPTIVVCVELVSERLSIVFWWNLFEDTANLQMDTGILFLSKIAASALFTLAWIRVPVKWIHSLDCIYSFGVSVVSLVLWKESGLSIFKRNTSHQRHWRAHDHSQCCMFNNTPHYNSGWFLVRSYEEGFNGRLDSCQRKAIIAFQWKF